MSREPTDHPDKDPRPATRRYAVCSREELSPSRVVVVPLAPIHPRQRREALVLLDENLTPRAYLNRCQHLPISLDGGSRDFFDEHFTHLRCGTHGAIYRLSDGMCTRGPCFGASLTSFAVLVEDGLVYLLDNPETAP